MHDIVLRFPSVEVYMPDPFNPPANPCDESQWVSVEIETPAIVQALSMNPTFLTLWIGNNDVLGAAYYATPIEGVTMTPASTFGSLYAGAMEAIVGKLFWERFVNPCGLDNLGPTSVGEIVVMTVPDVTAIPFVTSIAPYLNVPGLGHVPLIGSYGPLPEGEYIDENASMQEAVHHLVVGHHHSLIVTRGEEIVGVLRTSDIFAEIFQVMKALDY